MNIPIPTPLFLAFPERYMSKLPSDFSLIEFTENQYEWKPDPLFRLADHAKHPKTLIKKERGDCVDYARLAASVTYYQTDKPVSLHSFLTIQESRPLGHMVAYDGEVIYSSGSMFKQDIDDYLNEWTPNIYLQRVIRDTDESEISNTIGINRETDNPEAG